MSASAGTSIASACQKPFHLPTSAVRQPPVPSQNPLYRLAPLHQHYLFLDNHALHRLHIQFGVYGSLDLIEFPSLQSLLQ